MNTRSRRITFVLIVCGVMLGLSERAFADDLNPPPWTRSGAANRSTFAEWDFDEISPTNPLLPNQSTVIRGDFANALDTAFPGGAPHPSGFANDDLSYNGFGFINDTTGSTLPISFNVPNWIDQEPIKYLRLQVTYTGPTPSTNVLGFLGVPGDTALVAEALVDTVSDTIGQNSYFYQDWELRPNPDWEQVVLFLPPGTFVDQVVIDSISTPEPSSMVLGALGLLVLGRLARRRRPA